MTYHDKSSSRHHCWKHGTLGHFGTFFRTPWDWAHWALSNRPKASWNSSTWAWQMRSPWQLPNSCSDSGRLEGNGHDGHDGHDGHEQRCMQGPQWERWTCSINPPHHRIVQFFEVCTAVLYGVLLLSSLLSRSTEQGLCNKPSRLQLSAVNRTAAFLIFLLKSRQTQMTWRHLKTNDVCIAIYTYIMNVTLRNTPLQRSSLSIDGSLDEFTHGDFAVSLFFSTSEYLRSQIQQNFCRENLKQIGTEVSCFGLFWLEKSQKDQNISKRCFLLIWSVWSVWSVCQVGSCQKFAGAATCHNSVPLWNGPTRPPATATIETPMQRISLSPGVFWRMQIVCKSITFYRLTCRILSLPSRSSLDPRLNFYTVALILLLNFREDEDWNRFQARSGCAGQNSPDLYFTIWNVNLGIPQLVTQPSAPKCACTSTVLQTYADIPPRDPTGGI